MPSNERIILDQLLSQQKDEVAPSLSDSDFFEFYSAEQILKDYDLSYDEIDAGIVGGSNDGGIDSVFVLVNGTSASEDTDFSVFKRDVSIRLVIIQSKSTGSFSELAIDRLISTSRDLLNLDNAFTEFRSTYSEDLLSAMETFRRAVLATASAFPEISIDYFYVTKGDHVSAAVKNRVNSLEETLIALFSNANNSFSFVGSRELLNLAQREPSEHLQLQLAENPISPGGESFISLVNLRDFYSFMCADDGVLRRSIFDANVRDYEGEVEVNKDIRSSLEAPSSEDFWWLNNGITVLATQANSAGKTLNLRDPKVVNGLQTSQEIFKYFRDHPDTEEERALLVRVAVTDDDESRNKIIKATNNQTKIPAASLRATDQIQQDIEQYFLTRGLYYDRRKNYYKNQGKPKEKIISIPFLAQAIGTILLQEPNNARGRPTTLIKDDDDYARVFNSSYPIQLFYECALFLKRVDDFLRGDVPDQARSNRNNLRFHLAMYSTAVRAQSLDLNPMSIIGIGLGDIDDEFLHQCLGEVLDVFENLLEDEEFEGRADKVAKSSKFDQTLIAKLSRTLKSRG